MRRTQAWGAFLCIQPREKRRQTQILEVYPRQLAREPRPSWINLSTQKSLPAEGGHCWVPEAKLGTVSLEICCHNSDPSHSPPPPSPRPVTLLLPTLVFGVSTSICLGHFRATWKASKELKKYTTPHHPNWGAEAVLNISPIFIKHTALKSS